MCYVKGDDILISVEEKTDKVKYEYLRAYYTLWNSITHPENRVIVDLYAGTGHVIYKKNNGTKITIYGSPLQAILRTIAKPQNLAIILNEIEEPRFNYLGAVISEINEQGIPIFERNIPKSTAYYAIDNPNRKVKLRNEPPEKKYPDIVGAKPPRGFIEKKVKTRAEIVLRNLDAKDLLEEVFSKYIKSGTRKNKDGKEVTWKTKVIFLIDPCVHVNWQPLIESICERANREEGIEIIMNWNYSAIGRNLSNQQRTKILSEIYGIPEADVNQEFPETFTIEDYLEKYKAKLKHYFAYVNEVGVPRKRKIQPKMSDYREYFLIHCSNNASAQSLSSSKIKELKRKIVEHEDILKWAGEG